MILRKRIKQFYKTHLIGTQVIRDLLSYDGTFPLPHV